MPVIYSEADADLSALRNHRLSIIGYREMGRAIALNLRDSGLTPIIGEGDVRRAELAREGGFEVQEPGDAARDTDIKILAEPDEALPDVYQEFISPGLRRGDTLVFTSGYTIAFGFIEPPPFVDAVMISPRTLGADLRDAYLNQTGLLSFVSVGQDSSGEAWPRLLALAKAIGALTGGAMELSFQQQAELDLFVEQALLSAVHHVLASAADLLVSEGYPPEAAIMSLYVSGELGNTLSRAAHIGMMGLLARYSLTRQYGVLSRLDRYQDTKLRRVMETALDEIRNGRFAQEWTNEYQNGYPRLDTLRTRRTTMSLWKLERQAIQLMDQIATRPGEE
jgi:ketol-acid reductoisomerase